MTLKTDSKKYEYEIDTKTGEILSNSAKSINKGENANGGHGKHDGALVQDSYIGNDKALEIAVADSKLSENDLIHKKARFDDDDGIVVYEITLKTANEKYEYEINATTGEIIESEHKTVKNKNGK